MTSWNTRSTPAHGGPSPDAKKRKKKNPKSRALGAAAQRRSPSVEGRAQQLLKLRKEQGR